MTTLDHGEDDGLEHWIVHEKMTCGVRTMKTACGKGFRYPLRGTDHLPDRVSCAACLRASIEQDRETIRELREALVDALDMVGEVATTSNYSVSQFTRLAALTKEARAADL